MERMARLISAKELTWSSRTSFVFVLRFLRTCVYPNLWHINNCRLFYRNLSKSYNKHARLNLHRGWNFERTESKATSYLSPTKGKKSFLVVSVPFVSGTQRPIGWGYVCISSRQVRRLNIAFRNGAGPMNIAIEARLCSVCIMLHQQ